MEKLKTSIKTGNLTEDRRKFLKKAGGFAIMGMFGLSFFTSCSEDEPTPNNNSNPDDDNPAGDDSGITIDGSTISIDLTVVEDLNSAGGWLLIEDAQVLVVNDGDFNALTSVCTHSGCDNNWDYNNETFVCNCHGSQFSSSGEVISGPANSDLEQYTTSVDGDILTITTS